MELSASILSDVVVFMKYGKYIPELNRRETWEELVTRNKKMHIKKYPHMEEKINEVYQFVLDKKVLPSMRSMQFAGKPVELNPARVYNCCFLPIDDPAAFSELMFLLLSGVGVGYSVQRHHVEKLPAIIRPVKTRRYLVGDSIEGWSDAIKVLLKAYFGANGGRYLPMFDFSDIRPKGARLVTSGGKAPGPEPLKDCLHNIQKVLDRKETGERMTTMEVHDINCYIADAVLAGGIRRSAMIALFSFDDEDMLTSKFGNWFELHPHRARANNTAVILRHRIEEEDFFQLWEKIQNSQSGEPGFMFSNDQEWGMNPCAEISLRPFQFCVAGDTKLITRFGLSTIKELVGKETEIWNGKQWSSVVPYQTGTQDKLYRIKISDGSYLDATANHKFLVKQPHQKDFWEIDTTGLIEWFNGRKGRRSILQLPRSNVGPGDGTNEEFAYEYGFFLGDGNISSNKQRAVASLYGEDKQLSLRGIIKERSYYNQNGTEYKNIWFDTLNIELCEKLKTYDEIPSQIFTWNRPSILSFLAGWIDADGSNQSNGVRLYGTEGRCRDAQLLLTKMSINSSINLASRAGTKSNLGRRLHDLWYLQIVKTVDLPCRRVRCNNPDGASAKGKYQIIRSVEELEGAHFSYCLTETHLHQCVFGNVLTKQCNLTTINVSDVYDQDEFELRAAAAATIGTIQAGYTDFHYLRDIWRTTTEKEALIGVSMTGIASGGVLELDLRAGATVVKRTNEAIAAEIGIKRAARCTTVKPEGTSSLVLGSSSGIHAWHAPYYIRRMRIGKNESIYPYLMARHPELVVDEYFKPHLQSVIEVPQKAPTGAITRDESALDLLERVRHVYKNWIQAGHRSGHNKNNVSTTVSVQDYEWDEVGKWMWDNRNNYTAISCLPAIDHTYMQMPFEDISEETYNQMVTHLELIDLSVIIESVDETEIHHSIACSGNACEVV